MRSLIAALFLCLVATTADARCWKGETVSWYVDIHTASGERYRNDESTCAHRTAKFGTKLRVSRAGKSVVCRVNDRGPNKWTKCEVDLNKHAAKKLGIIKRGVAHAKIETVTEPAPLVEKARAFLGTNPTGWSRLWCGKFMAMIAPEAAKRVANPNLARSWTALPRAAPHVGAIVVLTRGGNAKAGHVGVVSGFDTNGNPRVVSGNHNRRVAEAVYPKRRVVAYVSGG